MPSGEVYLPAKHIFQRASQEEKEKRKICFPCLVLKSMDFILLKLILPVILWHFCHNCRNQEKQDTVLDIFLFPFSDYFDGNPLLYLMRFGCTIIFNHIARFCMGSSVSGTLFFPRTREYTPEPLGETRKS